MKITILVFVSIAFFIFIALLLNDRKQCKQRTYTPLQPLPQLDQDELEEPADEADIPPKS